MRASSGPAPGLLLLLAYSIPDDGRSSKDTGLPILGVEKGLLETSGGGEDGEVDVSRSRSLSCVLSVVLRLGGSDEPFPPPPSSSAPLRLVTPLPRVPVLVLLVGDSSSRSLVAPLRRLDRL